jgi:predicted short-subunit dehydrogenase-like oxidoreductase (DUF2520 family)
MGAGRLGSALIGALKQAGYRVPEVIVRKHSQSLPTAHRIAKIVRARLRDVAEAKLDADLVWFCVPDREIAPVARSLAFAASWAGKIAFHSSGALTSDELKILRQRGAAVASVHPLMTFARGVVPSLKSVPFAIEGDVVAVRAARKIGRDLGAAPFSIRQNSKAAYHAWGAFASPLIVAALATAERVAQTAGVSSTEARKKMLPIVKQTIANYATLGPDQALTGPLVRGDIEIVKKHLQILKRLPEARAVYASLARAAMRYLEVGQRKKLAAMLRS